MNNLLFIIILVLALLLILLLIVIVELFHFNFKKFRFLSLSKEQNITEGYLGVPIEPASMIGREGIASTALRPAGKILINNQLYDAISICDFIDLESKIIVVKYENSQLYVKEII